MKNVLVTGGAGFIGKHLALHLVKAGAKVLVLDDLSAGLRDNVPPQAEFVEGSVTNHELVAELVDAAEEIYHLAAVSSVEKSNQEYTKSHNVNLSAMVGLLDAIRRCGKKKLTYASSAAVYGAQLAIPIREAQEKRPTSAYGVDKYACELHAAAAFFSFGVPSTGLRFFNVYGEGQNPTSPYSGVISQFVDKISSGIGVEIHGDGLQTRDFIHVSDVVSAITSIANLEERQAEVYNVCTGIETSVVELVDIVSRVCRKPAIVTHGPVRAGDILRSAGCPDALERKTNFRPKISLWDGLTRDFQCLNSSQL